MNDDEFLEWQKEQQRLGFMAKELLHTLKRAERLITYQENPYNPETRLLETIREVIKRSEGK